MRTIEERLQTLLYEHEKATLDGAPGFIVHLSDNGAAITEPWNLAYEAMEAALAYDLSIHLDGTWYCNYCGGYSIHRDDCHVGKLQAALKAMKGDGCR